MLTYLHGQSPLSLTIYRPKDQDRINLDGGPANPDEPFDYNAVPTRFFYDVETVGGLDPDQIVTKGIHVLQEKLATVIKELQGGSGPDGVGFEGAQSPTMNGGYGGGPEAGYTTPGYGGASQWGGAGGAQGGTTPYGATPYGGSGW
jgi:DNA-directed RNA polymerase II subunit RPB3